MNRCCSLYYGPHREVRSFLVPFELCFGTFPDAQEMQKNGDLSYLCQGLKGWKSLGAVPSLTFVHLPTKRARERPRSRCLKSKPRCLTTGWMRRRFHSVHLSITTRRTTQYYALLPIYIGMNRYDAVIIVIKER